MLSQVDFESNVLELCVDFVLVGPSVPVVVGPQIPLLDLNLNLKNSSENTPTINLYTSAPEDNEISSRDVTVVSRYPLVHFSFHNKF